MITAILIWFIGWQFTFALGMQERDTAMYTMLNIVGSFLAWPLSLGLILGERFKEKDKNAKETLIQKES